MTIKERFKIKEIRLSEEDEYESLYEVFFTSGGSAFVIYGVEESERATFDIAPSKHYFSFYVFGDSIQCWLSTPIPSEEEEIHDIQEFLFDAVAKHIR